MKDKSGWGENTRQCAKEGINEIMSSRRTRVGGEIFGVSG